MAEAEIYTPADFTRFVTMVNASISKQPIFKPFIVTLKGVKDEVSRQQQKYIHGVVYPHLRTQLIENGYVCVKDMDDEDFDYFMRGMFYFKIVLTSKGEVKIPKRLCFGIGKKEEVVGYIDNLLRFGAEIGVHIPSPQSMEWYDDPK